MSMMTPMNSLPEPVAALVGALGQLPGIGPRSAERLALHLVQSESGQVQQLSDALLTARDRIQLCETCGALGQLPGIGPRSAERLALHLVQSESGQVQQLADALLTARDRIQLCETCGALTEHQPCAFCTDDRRDAATVCVVETAVDVIN
ncbi:MAG TPA: hypothetical protein EYQ62_08970, partial [Verrucomicrobiales bacterium]|nr:hypothetical protein [Verrucomicrobiales bacterium]